MKEEKIVCKNEDTKKELIRLIQKELPDSLDSFILSFESENKHGVVLAGGLVGLCSMLENIIRRLRFEYNLDDVVLNHIIEGSKFKDIKSKEYKEFLIKEFTKTIKKL